MDLCMASGAQALIDELDASLADRSNEQRYSMLRQVCDLFLTHAQACQAEQVSVFDDVMIRLMVTVPREALVELSSKLAPVDNAPSNVARRLASDNDMAIAGPMLTKSNAVTDKDLAAIVAEKGPSHLKAVINRGRIGEAVSDLLLERNDPELLCKLAGNDEVRFSEVGIVKEMLPFLKMANG